jgi:hypothetical protein
MTAEVAVLNRSAIALAADRAVTIESFSSRQKKTKVFNTANKLFSLSKYAPVGIMVYNTMTLGGVPWEAVIKQYRARLGASKFDHLDDYCSDFFSFLRANRVLFSEEDQRQVIEGIMLREFADVFYQCDTEQEMRESIEARIADLEEKERLEHLREGHEGRLEVLYRGEIIGAA